jgi:hypothetical protein
MQRPEPEEEAKPGAPAGPKSYPVIEHPAPDAIVVHCSDPRFQAAFRQFIETELGLAEGQYVPLVIGGGAGVLAHPERLPKEFKVLKDRLRMHMGQFASIYRIILINHEDCKYYEELRGKLPHLFSDYLGGTADKQRHDLGAVARTLLDVLSSKAGIERYYARFADPDRTRVTFDRVTF